MGKNEDRGIRTFRIQECAQNLTLKPQISWFSWKLKTEPDCYRTAKKTWMTVCLLNKNGMLYNTKNLTLFKIVIWISHLKKNILSATFNQFVLRKILPYKKKN